MRLTCNKKAYKEFKEECNKCPMKSECVDKGESVFVGLMEQSPMNINITFGNADVDNKSDVETVARKIEQALQETVSRSIGRW